MFSLCDFTFCFEFIFLFHQLCNGASRQLTHTLYDFHLQENMWKTSLKGCVWLCSPICDFTLCFEFIFLFHQLCNGASRHTNTHPLWFSPSGEPVKNIVKGMCLVGFSFCDFTFYFEFIIWFHQLCNGASRHIIILRVA